MEAAELRCGNLIFDDAGRVCFIEQVNSRLSTIKRSMVNKEYEYESGQISEFKPIPITVEWLKNFGFTRKENLSYAYYQKIAEVVDAHCLLTPKLFTVNEKCTNFFMNNNWLARIDYVHQLQNLYFALTNEELTFKN